jgi:ribosomal protein L35
MKKSVKNRFKITKRGKVLRRAMAQGHFLAKKSSRQIKRKKKLRNLGFGKKLIKKYS